MLHVKKEGKNVPQNFDYSIPRRMYYRQADDLKTCPECNSILTDDNCVVFLRVNSDTDEGNFLTNLSESAFCNTCPVVVFEIDQVEGAAIAGIGGGEDIRYSIPGIIDLASIPKEKEYLEIGSDENPMPLVEFLPALNTVSVRKGRKIGRNEPCPCGSGKKYKKCCGK